ncbi:putative Chitin synthase regulatory factor 3 [Glarea lozoyensis 74030]|uniref:Putative Chitin synthase regulatory factor 3 n=1 Tax=Glarea lozoyensis (strain ATCC 74030 / MF5533) TaxID=1104152 RepID=H0EKF8_GLAL7|nr:putative Chitin synthase regulatory factor 3 [Glarea lozoyensis 74030]
MSPDVPSAWDNPFPTLPGAKKKTSLSEEQDILNKMAAMEVGGPPQGRGRVSDPCLSGIILLNNKDLRSKDTQNQEGRHKEHINNSRKMPTVVKWHQGLQQPEDNDLYRRGIMGRLLLWNKIPMALVVHHHLLRPGNHKRGASIDEHIQPQAGGPPNGYTPQLKPIKSQPDFRGRAEPQTAVFEMAGSVPAMPPAPVPQAYDSEYGQQGGYGGPQNTNLHHNRTALFHLQEVPLQHHEQGNLDMAVAFQVAHDQVWYAVKTTSSITRCATFTSPAIRNYAGITPSPQQINPQQPPPQQQVQQPISMPAAPAPAPSGRPLSSAPVTAAELERLRQIVKGNPNDQASALQLARKLVEASESLVQTIPDQRTRNKTREKYVMDAHKILKKLVQAQNTDAMFFLADSHGRGALGLEPDNKEAFTLYQSAAKAGHAAAAYRTAVCCELGNEEGGGTRKDPLKAIQWYKRAATLGDTPAMYKMGMILLKGLLNQPKNPREAIGWLKRAAERADAENPHALHELGLLFEMPQNPESSVVRDEAYSFSLFQQAANLGYKYSQYRLGCAYEYGLFGCPVDPRQSIMWYSRAAAQEEHQSELSLSGWYLTGMEGVLQQSDTEAYLWARKAAMAGLAKAEYAMGYFTEVGIGSPANLEDAKRWYWRAAAQNFPKARERLEDLKRGGSKGAAKQRERISRSQQKDGECAVM